MAPFLPELISDVLLNLPVKSILRFRRLSTSICTEIDSVCFVRNHLNRSIQGKIRQKLIIHNEDGDNFYTADFDGGLKEAVVLNNPWEHPIYSFYAVGSCNGLILAALGNFDANFDDFELCLWNPFTRRVKKIPTCPVKTIPDYVELKNVGLGYDSALDDYKIIVISKFADEKIHVYYQVWIFSLKSNSWRNIQNTPLEIFPVLAGAASFANGTFYWRHRDDRIIAFELANEVFFNLPLFPGSGKQTYEQTYEDHSSSAITFYYKTVVVFGGDLYTNKLTAEGKTHEFYLHMSDKGGEELDGSWKKAFAVDEEESMWSSHSMPWPLAYSKEGDSILLSEGNEVFWYNPENKERRRVEIVGIPQAQREEYYFYVCWESLVSLGNDGI